MRIITGTARGHRLKAPPGLETRPTADRVKESMFSILRDKVNGAHVLDIFAGTGALGLEALSRGGAAAAFVDQSAASVRVIRENAAHTRLSDRARIIRSDVWTALDKFSKQGEKFDLAFCDPPYRKGMAQRALRFFCEHALLAERGVLVIEHEKGDVLALPQSGFLRWARSESYGATAVSFYQVSSQSDRKAEESEDAHSGVSRQF